MKKLLTSALLAALAMGVASSAIADSKVAKPFERTQFVVEKPGQVGYVGRKVAGPFDNTVFVIKNPGQVGFVKRGGDGGGLGGLAGGNGIK